MVNPQDEWEDITPQSAQTATASPDSEWEDITPGNKNKPIINFGQAGQAAGKAFFQPSVTSITQPGGDNPVMRAGQAALGDIYGQAKEGLLNTPGNPANKLSDQGPKFKIPFENGRINADFSPKSIARGAEGIGIDTAAGAIGGALGDELMTGASNMLSKPNPEAIMNDYFQGIRPTVAGKKTQAQIDKYKGNVNSSLDSITKNKENLGFEHGGLPTNVDEFSKAISTTKRSIFDNYDAMNQRAGKDGAVLSTQPIKNELDRVIGHKTIGIKDPSVVEYASKLKDRLPENLAPGEYQDLIEQYNSGLNAFYKNPNMSDASKAAVDAGVAHHMRKHLDNFIETQTGDQYQPLKNQYGALKSIEGDVNHRMVVSMRNSGKRGLLPIAEIFSEGDIIRGILTMNPGEAIKGAAKLGFIKHYEHSQHPDTKVANMFRRYEADANYPGPQQSMIGGLIGKLTKKNPGTDLVPVGGPMYQGKDVPQKMLPGPDDFRQRDIKAGRLLQGSQSNPVINAEGPANTIDMPQYLDSDFQRMGEKFDAPEFSNVRSRVSEADIAPKNVGQRGPNSKQSKLLKEIAKRRKSNLK